MTTNKNLFFIDSSSHSLHFILQPQQKKFVRQRLATRATWLSHGAKRNINRKDAAFNYRHIASAVLSPTMVEEDEVQREGDTKIAKTSYGWTQHHQTKWKRFQLQPANEMKIDKMVSYTSPMGKRAEVRPRESGDCMRPIACCILCLSLSPWGTQQPCVVSHTQLLFYDQLVFYVLAVAILHPHWCIHLEAENDEEFLHKICFHIYICIITWLVGCLSASLIRRANNVLGGGISGNLDVPRFNSKLFVFF